MRDHKDRGGLETGNLRKQFKNYENVAFIFQIRKREKIRKGGDLMICAASHARISENV